MMIMVHIGIVMRTDSLSICGISSMLKRNTTHSLANGSFMIIKRGLWGRVEIHLLTISYLRERAIVL